jgi:hypothetical protein
MDRALRIAWYDIDPADRDSHLRWVHESQIPALVTRPGIEWAAHYACDTHATLDPARYSMACTDDPAVPAGREYILIVAGRDARVFADRSIERLGDPEGAALAHRRAERVAIAVEAARTRGPAAAGRGIAVAAPCIQVGSFNVTGYEREYDLLEWYMSCRMPIMKRTEGCVGTRNFVSVAGWAKHVVLYEFATRDARERYLEREEADPRAAAWTQRILPALVHAPGSPNVATRLAFATRPTPSRRS